MNMADVLNVANRLAGWEVVFHEMQGRRKTEVARAVGSSTYFRSSREGATEPDV